jgi:hypothetical protein
MWNMKATKEYKTKRYEKLKRKIPNSGTDLAPLFPRA